MTLLQNDEETLPLGDTDELFVTRPNVDSFDNLLDGWTVSDFDENEGLTVRDDLEHVVDDGTTVAYKPGVGPDESTGRDIVASRAERVDAATTVLGEPWYPHEFGPVSLRGGNGGFPRRNSLELSLTQRDLLDIVAATDTPMVLVLVTGRPLALADMLDRVGAVVVAFFPGLEGGRAIADVLVGNTSPPDCLPITFPRSVDDSPVRHGWFPHPSLLEMGEHLPSYGPLFEFGFGLSYTEFTYDSPNVSGETITDGGEMTVSMTVTDIGDRAGTKTVQSFGEHRRSSMMTPVHELQGFTKAMLLSGETWTMMITLTTNDLRAVKPDGSRMFESGAYEPFVGDQTQTLATP